jgi:activator of HSP90 ATPase
MHIRNELALSVPTTGRRQWILGGAVAAGGLVTGSARARAVVDDDVSHTAEAIHQEVVFKASAKRIYDALTDAQQFQKVELLSGAMSGPDLAAKPAKISTEPGGSFSLFADYITGRQIELLPDQRIVQAWRVGSWKPGIYSLAHFELTGEGATTKLFFDHTGFPAGTGEHLASGWKEHYWEPLQKFLS